MMMMRRRIASWGQTRTHPTLVSPQPCGAARPPARLPASPRFFLSREASCLPSLLLHEAVLCLCRRLTWHAARAAPLPRRCQPAGRAPAPPPAHRR